MKKLDSDFTLLEYWNAHKHEIANKGWKCNNSDCSDRSETCTSCCTNHFGREKSGGTLKNYTNHVQKLDQHLSRSISELTYHEIRRALCLVQQERDYSASSMRSFLSCLCDIYIHAQEHGHAYNVLAFYHSKKHEYDDVYNLIDPTKSDKEILLSIEEFAEKNLKKVRSLTTWQMEKLVALLCEGIECDGRYIALCILLYCGLRPAELRALTFADVKKFIDHPERGYINIYKTMDKKGKIKYLTKTDNGYRKVPVHIELARLLQWRMEYVQQQYKGDIGNLLICCYENNFEQPCKDFQLANLAETLFEKIALKYSDLLIFQVEQYTKLLKSKATSSDEEPLTLYVLRRNFWTWMASFTQTTSYQKRYVMGHSMIENGEDLRESFNNEKVLWGICERLDRVVICKKLHKQSITYTVSPAEPLLISNRGICQIEIPRELLLHGGTISIDVTTEEAGDAVFMEILSGKRVLGAPQNVNVFPIPASEQKIVGINCEYENWSAHQKPVKPRSQEIDFNKKAKRATKASVPAPTEKAAAIEAFSVGLEEENTDTDSD